MDRARIIDQNFLIALETSQFPPAHTTTTPALAGLSREDFLDIFDAQIASRHLDIQARILREQNQGFYTIGSSGHEGNAAIAQALLLEDMGFLHYRSGALMIQRAKRAGVNEPLYDHLLALCASREDPISGGRHKVFGSKALNIPPQTSTIASHLPKALGYSFSLARKSSIAFCSFGDASFNHSTAQGALNAASWMRHQGIPLRLLCICEDNGIGISVPTPKDWIQQRMQSMPHWEYVACDGRNIADVYAKAKIAVSLARQGKPVFLHFKTVRLMGHAGSDIESQYRTEAEIKNTEADDVLLHSARIIVENNWLTPEEIKNSYENKRNSIAQLAKKAAARPKLILAQDIMQAIIPPKRQGIKHKIPDNILSIPDKTRPRNMAMHLNFALSEILQLYPQSIIFGEDVGKKGGVYRITADLQSKFGIHRVFDSLLDEQTILGTAIGMAHAGLLPLPEIQFLAYTHNAVDQIRGEAATLSFFSNGQFTNPMVIRIPALAYQKGFGGHFHNDNAIGFLREIPGIIIACPSNPKDAGLLLKACVRLAEEEQRVVIFLEPIALYMTKDLYQAGDNLFLSRYPDTPEVFMPGELGVTGESQQLAIITYGNGHYLSRQAVKILAEQHQIPVKLIDLRWLAPIDIDKIMSAIAGVENILIVDECRRTGSISEWLMTNLYEQYRNNPAAPRMARITGEDCFIPLGDAWQAILPSVDKIVAAARGMSC